MDGKVEERAKKVFENKDNVWPINCHTLFVVALNEESEKFDFVLNRENFPFILSPSLSLLFLFLSLS